MKIRKGHALIAAVVAAIAIPLVIASTASAEEDTQAPLQGLDAGVATLSTLTGSFLDAADGANRPAGADGTESEVPMPPLDGPVSGLIQNGPFK